MFENLEQAMDLLLTEPHGEAILAMTAFLPGQDNVKLLLDLGGEALTWYERQYLEYLYEVRGTRNEVN